MKPRILAFSFCAGPDELCANTHCPVSIGLVCTGLLPTEPGFAGLVENARSEGGFTASGWF
jgi:hypothetical protein